MELSGLSGNIRRSMGLRASLVAVLFAVAGGVLGQPRFEIEGNRFSFGMVPQNSTVANYFWFKSTGLDTVHIGQIKTGCDCAHMPLPRDWIAPGDSMLVGFFWETEHKIGSAGRYPYIYWSEHEDPARLFLTADISLAPDSSRPLSIKPFKAELSKLGNKSIDSVAITYTNHEELPLVLKVVSVMTDEYTFVCPDTIPPNGTAKGYVKLNPAYADKEFVGSVTCEYAASAIENKRFTIPIRRKMY
ncbi:hypothetical protein C3F09_07190 [candidate division GN15 bacterium]|uniref:DUF1573 domain-containing protein n=1 Tax=candidate division GN15 bacterium TaxID=2072418 RepID=A0A855X162_9BACT|nr:MAG: hypothetical protein C3F09_07190 [candidate division GN15 bacterium]